MDYKYKLTGIIFSIIIFILLTTAGIGYYYYLPRNVDFEKYEDKIRSVFDRRILYPSELGELEIELTWNFRARVKADTVSIKKQDGSKFIELGPSYLEVPILPLLTNRVILKKISINVLDADITRFDDGSFDVSTILAKVDKPKYRVSVNDADININGYNLNFHDNLIQPSKKYLFVGEEIKINNYSPDKYVNIKTSGKSFLNGKSNVDYDIFFASSLPFFESKKFHLGGKLTNMELSVINPYLGQEVTLQGKGDSNFDIEVYKKYFGKNKFFVDTKIRDLKVKTSEDGLISEHEGKLKVYARGYYNENLTHLDNFKVDADDVGISASGDVSKNDINLKLRLEDSQVHTIARIFPKIFKIKREPFKKILKYGTQATASGRVKLTGEPKKPNIYGKVIYRDLVILKEAAEEPKSFGKIDFVGPNMVLNNKVFLDESSYAEISGMLSPFRFKTANIDIITSEMDFNRAAKILAVAQDYFKLKLGPVEKMKFNGKGRVNLKVGGEFSDSELNGYVEGKGLELKYEGLAGKAQNIEGRLIFADKKVYYDQLTGFSNGMKLFPSGYSTLKGYSDVVIKIPELQLNKGLDFVKASPLLREAKQALKDVVVARGRADATINLKGTDDDLKTFGQLVFNNGHVMYKGFGVPFERIRGVLKFQEKDVYFENLSGVVIDSRASVSGIIKGNQEAELKILAGSINMESARRFVERSPVLEKAEELLDDYVEIKGKSGIEINLKGNLEGDPFRYLVLRDMDFYFNHKLAQMPVYLNKGSLKITEDSVNARSVQGNILGTEFNANGVISNIKNYTLKGEPFVLDFRLTMDRFDFRNFSQYVKAPLTPLVIKEIFVDFDAFHGFAKVEVNAKPEKQEFKFIPVNVSAVYQPYDVFFLVNSGVVSVSNEGVDFSSLKGVVSESTFNFNGFANKNAFDLNTTFNINSKDIVKFRFYSDIPLVASGVIPLSFTLEGKPEDWHLSGRMMLEKGSYISYFTDVGLPRNQVRYVNIDARGNKNRINIDRLGIDMGEKNLVSVHGAIDKINSSRPEFKNFIIKTNSENPINTDFFNSSIGCVLDNGCDNFFSSGIFKADLKLNGYVVTPQIFGSAAFQDVRIPDYQSYIKQVNLNFAGDSTKIDISGVNIGESLMNITASMDSKLESPVLIKNLQINSPILNINQLAQIFPRNSGSEHQNLPPFIIAEGSVNAGQMVVRNLITTNVKASFNFTPDWLLSVPSFSLVATNGVGQGSVLYNLKTTELSSKFKIRGMEANAVATTILTLPNEVYGTVDSDIQFSTRGRNQQELIANSNGFAEFMVNKGHFTRLGSLEYLLRAVNVLHSGVGGFNLNNIIDLISPQKTGHFERLQGSVYARNGVLYTDDITTSGKNLSLFISGKLDMLTNKADIQVLGRLSKKVSGMLGPVGSISINQFIDYIPGLGFLPATPDRKGVIDLIPGLSKIPGLELADNDKYRRFAVQIDGNLYDQNSVRSFRWIE